MNIWGYEQKLKKAREMLRREEYKRGANRNPEKIKKIKSGMDNIRNKINILRANKKTR